MKLAFVASTAFCCSAAFADITLLDIPDGVQGTTIFDWSSEQGVNNWGFTPNSTNIWFHGDDGWASQGVLYVKGNDATGVIDLVAETGFEITLESFAIAGWNSAAAEADFRLFIDGELTYDSILAVAGGDDYQTFTFDQLDVTGSVISLEFTNLTTSRVGIDNIEVGSINVPAPGALALLGIAGVAGSRRRRG